MHPPPNELYTAFSFIGFILCVIPLYWHLRAWNTGTCLYMIWTGLGCLIQFVNSLVWNKNTTNRAPVYCDISTRVQVALNVAIPACSLCINRRLYKIATVKDAMITRADKRRAVIQDLLIGVGLPILQIISQYIISKNRYDIFEDFGPSSSSTLTPLTFVLFLAWPVAIGTVSLFYCVTAIYLLFQCHRQLRQVVTSSQFEGLSRGRYLRLIALASVEILGTIPLGTYVIVSSAKGDDVTSWRSWTSMHHHYSEVFQFSSVVWKNEQYCVISLEMFRWSLVVCSFTFFAFFGFAEEAREHYRLLYTFLVSCTGYSMTSTSTLRESPHVTSSAPYAKSKPESGVVIAVVKMGGDNWRSKASLTDEPSIRSTSIAGDTNLDFKVEQYSSSNIVISSSVESLNEFTMQGRTTQPAGMMPTIRPASFPPDFPGKTKPTTGMRACSGIDAV